MNAQPSAQQAAAHARARHWRANKRLSIPLLLLWLGVTLGVAVFGDILDQWTWLGPLGFYMAAQGALLIYLAIIGFYAWRMRRIDEACGLSEENPT